METDYLTLDSIGKRVLMTGNGAVARGAIEAGVKVATSYPGTPASEILSSIAAVAKRAGIYAEWSINEKVAFEVAFAASLSGIRALMACKHLGFNWISDAFLVSAYTGVNGGLVVAVSDDPHPHSSQNAEDTRYYSKMGKVPCLEPSDPGEAKKIIPMAFDLSESLQLPIVVRLTSRISHSRGDVELGEIRRGDRDPKFEKDPKRYAVIAPHARERHLWLNTQYAKAAEAMESFPLNWVEGPRGDFGIIANGLNYSYVKEALGILGIGAPILKLSSANPIPRRLVANFLRGLKECLVVEEIEPITEDGVKAIAQAEDIPIKVYGRSTGHIPLQWELNPDIVAGAISKIAGLGNPSPVLLAKPKAVQLEVGRRTPFLCAGCPHRASYYSIKQALRRINRGGIIAGDRGCYNQGIYPPLNGYDTCICMGASIGMACGFYKAGVKEPIVAVIGESTFFHAGIPPLINAVHNNANITVVIFDNSWTSMTGFQPNPATGMNAMGEETRRLNVEEICKACGVEFIKVVDSFRVGELIEAIESAINFPGPAVVVSRHECAVREMGRLRRKGERPRPYAVDPTKCTACKICLSQFGCPAISIEDGKISIDKYSCTGCGVCAQICPSKAIVRVEG
ncbi:MAG: indolepyruvate ferredoxin oxidoreductase subunit alpha [Candidatus Bathyarchaeia archaeon]